ncbi:MAG: uridine kinase [Candidatus Omnitrophota bacterium]|jgi:uridine kinase
MKEENLRKPFILAIAGGSASGKTTIARQLLDRLGEDTAGIFSQDSYYRDLSHLSEQERKKVNFDHPDAMDLALFKEQLKQIKEGRVIQKPVYDYGIHARRHDVEEFRPKPVIIVEGLFVLLPELLELYDHKVYVDTPDDIRLARRILRDIKERGRKAEDVVEQYLLTVKPMHEQYVRPTCAHADQVFSGDTSSSPSAVNEIMSFIRKGLGLMKILVIGSEGFVGGYLTRDLLALGHQVVGFDVGQADKPRSGYELFPGDLMDSGALRRAAGGADIVINLAAKHHDFGISREDFFLINEEGTRRILNVLSDLGIKKFIFFSSVAVYGEMDRCSSEDCPPKPSNDYGESKWAAEKLIQAWVAADPQREVLVIRPTVVYGPHNYANMYRLIDMIYKRRFFFVGKGDNIKTVTYVENLSAAAVFLMGRLKPGLEVYNYADYPHYTSAQIVRFITDSLGRKPYKWHLPLKPILMVTGIVDVLGKMTGINFPITANRISKINAVTWHGSEKLRQLGFKPAVTVEEGIKRMVAWYEEKKIKKQCWKPIR